MDVAQQQRIAELRSRFEDFRKFEQVNNAAVDAKWRDILVADVIEQQKESIDKVRASYTKQLDRCDAIIHRLFQWLEEGEKQYQFALRAHKHNLEHLQALSSKRLDLAFEQFQRQLETVKTEYNRNREVALEQYQRHVMETRHVTAAIEHEYEEKKTDMTEKFRNEQETIQSKSQDIISQEKTHLQDRTKEWVEKSDK